MQITAMSPDHLLNLLEWRMAFSFPGYSDAEWYCILGVREGERSGLGQVFSTQHGCWLLDALRRRQDDGRWMPAVPKVLYTLPEFCDHQIDWFLGRENIKVRAFERDGVTDDLAREAGLFPLIQALKACRPILVGPEPLRACTFLDYRAFIPIETPNLHLREGGIDHAARAVLRHVKDRERGERHVVCVSAGVSAACIIDLLHDKLPNSVLLDLGSMWDAFVSIGGQRQWRAELYADPEALEQWRRKCLTGRD